jgi:hypothetical protein
MSIKSAKKNVKKNVKKMVNNNTLWIDVLVVKKSSFWKCLDYKNVLMEVGRNHQCPFIKTFLEH